MLASDRNKGDKDEVFCSKNCFTVKKRHSFFRYMCGFIPYCSFKHEVMENTRGQGSSRSERNQSQQNLNQQSGDLQNTSSRRGSSDINEERRSGERNQSQGRNQEKSSGLESGRQQNASASRGGTTDMGSQRTTNLNSSRS